MTSARFAGIGGIGGIGGMQTHTGELTRALDGLGVDQRVVTAWRPRRAVRRPLPAGTPSWPG